MHKTLLLSLALATSLHAQTPAQLEAQITALQQQIHTMQTANAVLQGYVTQIRNSPVMALAPYIQLDLNSQNGVIGPNLSFVGLNIHILNGSGTTGGRAGTGNLIIGYDEAGVGELQPGDRSGSHCLIVGTHNKWTANAWGGFVGGEYNTLSNGEDTIIGGSGNSCVPPYCVVLGGNANVAQGWFSVVGGGFYNIETAAYGTMLGGFEQTGSATEYNTSIGPDQ
jgi:hypothetical protein